MTEKITDAEYEIVTPARGQALPWWRRIYFDRNALLIAGALAVLGVAKLVIGGRLGL